VNVRDSRTFTSFIMEKDSKQIVPILKRYECSKKKSNYTLIVPTLTRYSIPEIKSTSGIL